jgi:hypothetical protein
MLVLSGLQEIDSANFCGVSASAKQPQGREANLHLWGIGRWKSTLDQQQRHFATCCSRASSSLAGGVKKAPDSDALSAAHRSLPSIDWLKSSDPI